MVDNEYAVWNAFSNHYWPALYFVDAEGRIRHHRFGEGDCRKPLIEAPKSHAALFGAEDASKAGLPVVKADPKSEQWEMIWRLWAKYFALGPPRVYEGHSASKVLQWPTGD